MDFGKINKALHGGLAAAIAAIGGTGGVSVTLPAGTPHAGVLQYVLTAIAGFVVGFVWTYLAPANTLTIEQKTKVLSNAGVTPKAAP